MLLTFHINVWLIHHNSREGREKNKHLFSWNCRMIHSETWGREITPFSSNTLLSPLGEKHFCENMLKKYTFPACLGWTGDSLSFGKKILPIWGRYWTVNDNRCTKATIRSEKSFCRSYFSPSYKPWGKVKRISSWAGEKLFTFGPGRQGPLWGPLGSYEKYKALGWPKGPQLWHPPGRCNGYQELYLRRAPSRVHWKGCFGEHLQH